MSDSSSVVYTLSEIKAGPSTVPAFLTKLWSLVSNSESDELIYWSENGTSFHVHDPARFAKEVLPFYFKHNNMASFVRQLNMYGFRKVVNVESGSLKFQSDDLEFCHPYFCLGHEDLLIYIKRKGSSASVKVDEKNANQQGVEGMLSNCKRLQERQDKVDAQLISLKRENEALWNEVAVLRQKHSKQQQVVNKLIQFLVSLVQSSGRSVPLKRKVPLAIKGRQRKYPKTDRRLLSDIKQPSPEGVIISDVLQDSDSDNLETVTGQAGMSPEMLEELSNEPLDLEELLHEMPLKAAENENVSAVETEPANIVTADMATSPIVTSPLSDFGQQEAAVIQGDDVPVYPVLPPTTTTVAVPAENFRNRSELQEKVDATSSDLDSLKRLLSTGSYNFDVSEFLGVNNPLSDFGSFPSTSNDDASILEILSYLQDESNEQEQLPVKPSSPVYPSASTTGKELVQFISPADMGLPDTMLFDNGSVLELPDPVEDVSADSVLNTPSIDKSLL